jgi:hypothetical protein
MSTYTGAGLILAGTIAAALSAACGGGNGESTAAGQSAAAGGASGVVGDYGGDQCVYDKLTFANNGIVYMTVFGTDQAGQYQIDGDRIVVTAGGQSAVFTRNGSNLEANVLGERMVCAPLASGDSAEIYEATTDEGRITLELRAGGQARMTMVGADASERMSFDVRYESGGNRITVEMPGDEPLELIRDGRELVSTAGGESVRFVRR